MPAPLARLLHAPARTDLGAPRALAPGFWAVGLAILLLGGCQRAPDGGGATAADAKSAEAKDAPEKAGGEEGVTLKAEEIPKAGIQTVAAAAARHAPDVVGYGVVVAQDAIAQAAADLATAAAAEQQSSAALARARGLAGTPGAGSVEALELAERQAALDRAAHALAVRKLAALYGGTAPWQSEGGRAELGRLAGGAGKLVRVTFPLGTLGATMPKTLRLAPLDAAPEARAFASRLVWAAPADATVPGRSLYAIVSEATLADGERLVARAEVGVTTDGVIVPFASVVLSAGRYWCYVEEKPGHYVRTEVTTEVATDDGYFVREGIEPGAKIVSAAAGVLLAKELGTAAAD